MPSAPIPQLRQIRTDLADRAERSTLADGKGGTISCPDAQLQIALRGVVRAIDQLPSLEKPEIAAVEGSEATIEAFRRLTTTFFGLLSFKLPPSADELRALQQRAVQSIENPAALRALNDEAAGLSKRDYIPLGTAIFVDLCLLLVSIGRPMNRFVATRQRMIEAERGPVFPILSRFNEIHNHEEMRRTFDVFREVIFELGGTYYVAVPLNAPRAHPEREELRRDAQTLANLCYALEGQGVLTRPWKIAPMLVAQRKLRRQGSKFIECYRDQHVAPVPRAWRRLKSLFVSDRGGEESPAFRIYAFKSGAWPELILGAVMGAAGRVEAGRRRQQQATSGEEETMWNSTRPGAGARLRDRASRLYGHARRCARGRPARGLQAPAGRAGPAADTDRWPREQVPAPSSASVSAPMPATRRPSSRPTRTSKMTRPSPRRCHHPAGKHQHGPRYARASRRAGGHRGAVSHAARRPRRPRCAGACRAAVRRAGRGRGAGAGTSHRSGWSSGGRPPHSNFRSARRRCPQAWPRWRNRHSNNHGGTERPQLELTLAATGNCRNSDACHGGELRSRGERRLRSASSPAQDGGVTGEARMTTTGALSRADRKICLTQLSP